MALQQPDAGSLVLDLRTSSLDGVHEGLGVVMGVALEGDKAVLKKVGALLQVHRVDLDASMVLEPLCYQLMCALAIYYECAKSGASTREALADVMQLTELIPAAARCRTGLLAAVQLLPQLCLMQRSQLLALHLHGVKNRSTKSRAEVAVELGATSREFQEASSQAMVWVHAYARNYGRFINELVDFAHHDPALNAGALQSYAGGLAASASAPTPQQALMTLTTRGAPILRHVFAAHALYTCKQCAALAEAALLLDRRAHLPQAFADSCRGVLKELPEIAALLRRTADWGTLKEGFCFLTAVSNEAFISNSVSKLTHALAPVISAFNSTAAVVGLEVGPEAPGAVQAQATDLLRGQERTHRDQAAMQRQLAALQRQVEAKDAQLAALRADVIGRLDQLAAGQQQLAAYQQTANTQAAALLAQGQLLAQQQGCSMAVHAATLVLAGNPALAQAANQNLSANRARLTSAAASPAKPFTGFTKPT